MSRREQNLEINELEMIWFLQSERDRGALTFREAVYQLVSLIPAGSVLGYGQVASLLGSPRAARQVGFALRALLPQQADPQQEDCIPWWRVLRTSGQSSREIQSDPKTNDSSSVMRG